MFYFNEYAMDPQRCYPAAIAASAAAAAAVDDDKRSALRRRAAKLQRPTLIGRTGRSPVSKNLFPFSTHARVPTHCARAKTHTHSSQINFK